MEGIVELAKLNDRHANTSHRNDLSVSRPPIGVTDTAWESGGPSGPHPLLKTDIKKDLFETRTDILVNLPFVALRLERQ